MENSSPNWLQWLEFVPQPLFLWLPLIVAGFICFVAYVVLWNTSRPQGTSALYRIVCSFWWGTLAALLSAMWLFVYILLQPMRGRDSRWLQGVPWASMPAIPTIPSTNVFGVSAVVDGINGALSGVNTSLDWLGDTYNLALGYTVSLVAAVPMLLYVVAAAIMLAGLTLVVMVLKVAAALSYMRAQRKRIAELTATINQQHHVMAVQQQAIAAIQQQIGMRSTQFPQLQNTLTGDETDRVAFPNNGR